MDHPHNFNLHSSEDNNVVKMELRDRLSELPNSLILEILSLMEMRYVVRSTILSKRWKDLWTTVPCLYLCGEYANFIKRALAKWKGTKILEFSISFRADFPLTNFLDSLLLVPIENRVEDLFINLRDIDFEYSAPQPLYSCSSITKLSLAFCDVIIEDNVNVQWNNLKSLKIEYPSYFSEDAINRILSASPLLEELILLGITSININIRSTSLKMLEINMDVGDFEGNASVLEIRAPNLKSLKFSGLLHTKCLINVPSLTNASLDLDHHYYYIFKESSRYTLLEESLRQAF